MRCWTQNYFVMLRFVGRFELLLTPSSLHFSLSLSPSLLSRNSFNCTVQLGAYSNRNRLAINLIIHLPFNLHFTVRSYLMLDLNAVNFFIDGLSFGCNPFGFFRAAQKSPSSSFCTFRATIPCHGFDTVLFFVRFTYFMIDDILCSTIKGSVSTRWAWTSWHVFKINEHDRQ